MKYGFVIPRFIGEKRVALLPEQVKKIPEDVFVEYGFGNNLDISDSSYLDAGCRMATRRDILTNCEAIFSLKVLHPSDYEYIQQNQILIGWTHPTGSGIHFMKEQAIPKNLVIVDIANNAPLLHYTGKQYSIPWIPKNFNFKNAITAGYSSVYHALISHNIIIEPTMKVAVLGSGNVSQGAFSLVSKLGGDVRLFYRNNLIDFINAIDEYDIIINGIEINHNETPIISISNQDKIKEGCLIIDAAADAGYAIEGTKYTSLDNPIYQENSKYFYVVNNTPSLFYKSISRIISEAFVKYVYCHSISEYTALIK